MNEQQRAVIPFSNGELTKLYHVLKNSGQDPQRLSSVTPSQIVYSRAWDRSGETPPAAGSSAATATEFTKTIAIANHEASIVTGIRFSVVNPMFAASVIPTGGGAAVSEWHRADDPDVFCSPRNPLDYIYMHVRQTSSEQLSTDYVPLSHWEERVRDGWMPSTLDFIPGGNYSAYQLLFRSDKHIFFDRLNISLTAIKLTGL